MRNAPGINGKEQHDKYGNHPFFEAAKPRRLFRSEEEPYPCGQYGIDERMHPKRRPKMTGEHQQYRAAHSAARAGNACEKTDRTADACEGDEERRKTRGGDRRKRNRGSVSLEKKDTRCRGRDHVSWSLVTAYSYKASLRSLSVVRKCEYRTSIITRIGNCGEIAPPFFRCSLTASSRTSSQKAS